ncbi:TonB-dependent siderophore receptor [Paraglaciecola arctica]|uniref:Iron complex outermembrane recepter protein n=1 Tax=Paraglaciecola arctica BSs20135 TaxID=493475 RepID=K6XB71_9ALTE|nr:TonB-dependent siderophore receptor [Paraglaciecola arctica]GAC17864.1 iron complex outermembrane recepter protein [Paraglaciecola arctica BSs20135]
MITLQFKKSKLAVVCATALSVNNYSVLAAEDVEKSMEVISVVGHKLTELSEENNGGALGKRSVLETPFSVDVISLEDMQIRQVNTLDSLFSREASVSVDGSAYSAFGDTLRVRGLALDYTQSFKVNGMSINSFSGELPYEAFQQVTLIKGATGFMYGMAAPGGVVNYVTKKAKKDEVSVALGMRSDSVFSGHVDASTRIGNNDEYGLRVNLVKETGDTYLDGGSIDRDTASLAFDAQLTDSLYWTVDVIYNDRLIENSWTQLSNALDSTDSLPDTVSGTRNLAVEGTFDEYENLIAITSLNWTINDNWNARVDYDYSKNETRWVKHLTDLLNSAGDLDVALYEQYFDVEYEQVQAVLTGEVNTGSVKHNLVIGASHQKATTYRNDGGEYGRIVTWGYASDNLFNLAEVPAYSAELKKDIQMAWIDTQDSIFISDFISITDQWEALVGVRSNGIKHTPSEYFSAYHEVYDDTAVTPTVALMFKPDANTTYYASYVESIEGQTSSVGESYENANELLAPLDSSQYELGLKAVGDGWSVTSALFRIERGATLITEDNYVVQEGVTLYQGLEFSGALEVSENLSFYGDFMLLNSEYDKTTSQTEGNNVGGAPKKQFSLQSNYNVAALPGLTLNLGAKYHGTTTLDASNIWELPAYTVVYGGVSYNTTISGQKVTLIGTIDNMFDKQYWAVSDSYSGLRIGEPRTFAVKVKMDF